MKLVIDIPSHVKNRLIFGVTYKDDLRILVEALANGTPLPKGYGRLIKADDVYNALRPYVSFSDLYDVLDEIPTIIEDNGGGEDG